jgi:prephenate dehydrogenase
LFVVGTQTTVQSRDIDVIDSTLKNLLVVGGADGIGMWLVKHVFVEAPDVSRITLADVKVLYRPGIEGLSNPDAKHVAELARVKKPIDVVRLENRTEVTDWVALGTAAEPPSGELALGDYDLMMLAVPEDQIEAAASDILPSLRPGAAVFDVTSTKERAISAMLKYAPKGVSVLGTHPLFGPAVPDVIGQTFVIVPTECTDTDFYDWLKSLLRSQGAIVEETDAETHDRYMLLVQTLAHYAYLVFGKTLAHASEMGYSFDQSFRFSTPPYGILTAFTARIIGGNPGLYAQIQGQPDSDALRSMFVQAAGELAGQFAKGESEILAAIEEIIQPFKGGDVARAYANSIALVDSVQQSYRDLYRRMESHELTIVEVRDPFEQRATSRLHVGIVIDVDGHSVEIAKRQTIVNGKWYLAYDEMSESALKKAGKGLRGETARIERRNIRRVFSPEETRNWRASNLDHHQRDIAVLVDDKVDMEHICAVLTRLNDAVVSGAVLEPKGVQWLERYGMHNMLLRFTMFGDRNPDACVRDLVESLRLFGIRTQG